MGGSTCIITVLLLTVVFLQTASWKLLALMPKRTQVGNNSQVGLTGRGFQDHLGYLNSLEMKEGEYKLRK